MWKDIAEQGRPQMTIWRMRFACCIPKTTVTYSEYVILIGFSLQQWLQERTSMLWYTYGIWSVFYYILIFILRERSLNRKTSILIETILEEISKQQF
jgi:hypothetical protein